MTDTAGASSLLDRWLELVEARITHHVEAARNTPGCPVSLAEAMAYALQGGKRLRPLLLLGVHHACSGGAEPPVDAACAVEMVHVYSLIHDDLPAMDDDDVRRGRPSCHKAFGEAMAILAGDALLAFAFEVLAGSMESARVAQAVLALARAAGPAGMVGGQADDIAPWRRAPTVEQSERIAARKTGALMSAACRIGALCAGARPVIVENWASFGTELGIAFQIGDDLLSAMHRADELKRPTGSDERHHRPTHTRAAGLENSLARKREVLKSCRRKLDALCPGGTPVRLILDRMERRLDSATRG